jgi:cytochrome c-type biogenesis protein CcmF
VDRAVAAFSRQLPAEVVARVLGVMGLISVGFLAFILWTSNPFERLLPGAAEGQDLNPLLQDIGMIATRRCSTWATSASRSPSHSPSPH